MSFAVDCWSCRRLFLRWRAILFSLAQGNTSKTALGPGSTSDRPCCHAHTLWNPQLPLASVAPRHTHTHTHTFNDSLSGTSRVSRYLKGKTNLDFTEARDSEWQWHQLGHMQVCTSLQTDNHARTLPLSLYRPDALPAAQPTASKHWRQTTPHIAANIKDGASKLSLRLQGTQRLRTASTRSLSHVRPCVCTVTAASRTCY